MTEFQQQVYEQCSRIPAGRVSTYKEIAQALGGSQQTCRAVGNALNKNPFAPKVPCHRVVTSSGKLGGFAFGDAKKQQLLMEEGVSVEGDSIQNFQTHFFPLS